MKCKQCGSEFRSGRKLILLCPFCRSIRNKKKRLAIYKRMSDREPLGTTDFDEHRCDDFRDELYEIRQEYKKLGLKHRKH